MTEASIASLNTVPSSSLGGPGPAEPMRCAATAIAAMGQASGGLRMTSLALELASQDIRDGVVEIRTAVNKQTRSILFVSVEARVSGQLVFTAQGLFSGAGSSK